MESTDFRSISIRDAPNRKRCHSTRSHPGSADDRQPGRIVASSTRVSQAWIDASVSHSLCERVAIHVRIDRSLNDRGPGSVPPIPELFSQYPQQITAEQLDSLGKPHRFDSVFLLH